MRSTARFVRSLLLALSVILPLSLGECMSKTCSEIPDQPHDGVCDPFRS